MRCRIAEDEEPASAQGKLRATLDEHILDRRGAGVPRAAARPPARARRAPGARPARTCSPRGASSSSGSPRRLSDGARVRGHAVGRREPARLHRVPARLVAQPPDLRASRSRGPSCSSAGRPGAPGSAASPRSTSSRSRNEAMEELLAGLVPGLPAEVRDRILERAEGDPALRRRDGAHAARPRAARPGRRRLPADGTVEALEVPETLHALIAARLDGVSAEERRLLQDAAVLGKTFTKHALAALAGLRARASSRCSRHSSARRCSACRPIPARPSTASTASSRTSCATSRTRRSRSASASAPPRRGRVPRSAFAEDEDEIVEVVASHYLDAYEAAPDADDAAEIRAQAQAMLARAGERAASLAAAAEARRYFEQAAELAERAVDEAALVAKAGEMAARAADPDGASRLLEESINSVRGRGRHAQRRARLGTARARSSASRAGSTTRSRGWSGHSTSSPATSRTRISPLLAARLANAYWYGRRPRASRGASRARARHRARRRDTRRCSRSRLGAKAAVRTQPWAPSRKDSRS